MKLPIIPIVLPILALLPITAAYAIGGVDDGEPGLPLRTNCYIDVVVAKEAFLSDANCAIDSRGLHPYRKKSGDCQRYKCNAGTKHYYSFSGWTDVTPRECAATEQLASCPSDSCAAPE